LSILDPNLKN